MKENNSERFEQLGTKIDPAMAKVLNACCDAMEVDVYHMLQWFAYVIIRMASPMHNLDPRIRKLMFLLDHDAGWQTAFNIANPDDLNIAQVVLILEQKNHKGFGAVMVDKPFMGEATQTECVDDILERVAEVTMHGIYRKLRALGKDMDCDNLSDVLLTMIDAQDIINATESDQSEMPQMGDRTEGGRRVAYGKKTKAKQHRTPDSYATDQRLQFEDIDHDAPAPKLEDWEGEQHDTR